MNDQSQTPLLELTPQHVTYHPLDGAACTIQWDELSAVLIETTDEGPFVEDVWWILIAADHHCIIPQEVGSEALLARLQELPNFDNDAVIAAMASVENQRFLCWQLQPPADKSQ